MSVALDGASYAYPGSGGGVSGLSLEVRPGELLAVIGPSGCGKTTILKLLAGFLQPDSGRVLIEGRDASGLPARERNIGVVFQSYALFPHMSAAENVAYPLKIRGVPREERRRKAEAALDMVGLTGFAGRKPQGMSGGQQQRIALARALVFDPRALLLDEPLSALDASLRVGMRDEIRRVQRAAGIATLHITHDQEEALSMADRVAVMGAGRLLQVGTPREIYDSPASRAVAAFVGHANLIEGRIAPDGTAQTPIGPLRLDARGRAPGEAVTLLVRPERIAVGPAPDGVNSFGGRVLADRFLGSIRRCDVAVEGARLVIETARPDAIAAFHIPPSAIQVLDAGA